jgi:hypothetical protein
MNQQASDAGYFGTALTEREMVEVTGGSIAYAIGYCIGLFAAMVEQTATSLAMQQYSFGA